MSAKSFTVAACGLFLMFGLCVLGLTSLNKVTPPNSEVSSEIQISEESVPCYLLKIHNEQLAVFDSNKPDLPIEIIDVDVSTLRNYDREQLTVGILVHGRQELLMLLEDYCS